MTVKIPEVPGLNILTKYNYKFVKDENLTRTIETSGIIPHFDRQRLFSLGWKADVKYPNQFIFDLLLCK